VPPLRDLTGQKFGRLTVQWPAGISKHGHVHWLCLCACKQIVVVNRTSLRSGDAKSCGCLRRELQTTHGHTPGHTKSPEFRSWEHMVHRCTNPNSSRWKYYGGAGVEVSPRWRNFENFLADMGPRPLGTTLGRFGDIGNYKPGNCVWMTQAEQVANRRRISKFGVV